MKLHSVCRAKQMLKNGTTPRSLANFYTELEWFCEHQNRAFTLFLNRKKNEISGTFFKNSYKLTRRDTDLNFFVRQVHD